MGTEGKCKDCGQFCLVGFVPCPERVYISHTKLPLCSLCYQMNRTLQQVRRIRRNTIHHQYFMVELENMEKYAKGLAASDDLIVQNVLPWRREDEPLGHWRVEDARLVSFATRRPPLVTTGHLVHLVVIPDHNLLCPLKVSRRFSAEWNWRPH